VVQYRREAALSKRRKKKMWNGGSASHQEKGWSRLGRKRTRFDSAADFRILKI